MSLWLNPTRVPSEPRKDVDLRIAVTVHSENEPRAESPAVLGKPIHLIATNNQLPRSLAIERPALASKESDDPRDGKTAGMGRFASRRAVSTLQFLRDVARSPVQMGAIAPSGRQLARAMVNEARVGPGHVVVELGAGSGSFTRELLARHPDNPLTVFELSSDLAAGLRRDFPRAQVVAAAVEDLPKVAADLGIVRIDRVVSGLPWALWSEARQVGVLDALAPYLAPGARMVSFHYIHSRSLGRVATTRRLLLERFTRVTHSAPVWANVPPAYVHIADGPRGR